MSFCDKCGAKVELGDIYCPSCGVKLSEISAGKASAGPRAHTYKVGAAICGSELGSYLSNHFSEGDVESITRGINSERKFTVLAMDLHGRGIDWHQYEVAPVGMKSRSVVVGVFQRTNYFDWFEVELWEYKPPNCMVLRDRAGSLGLLDTFDKGLQI